MNTMTQRCIPALLTVCSMGALAQADAVSLVLEARLQTYRLTPDPRLMQGATFRFTVLFDTDAPPDATTADSATYHTAWMYEFVDRPLGEPDIRQIGAPDPNGPSIVLKQGGSADVLEVRFGNALNGVAQSFSGMDIRVDAATFPGSGPPAIDALATLPGPPTSAFDNTDLVAVRCTLAKPTSCIFINRTTSDADEYLIHAPRYKLVQGPVIFDQPDALAVTAGDQITLTTGAAAYGTPTYRWSRNGEPLNNGGRVAGADTPALTINGAIATDNGVYTVAVTDNGSTTVSEPAVVAVLPGTNCNAADLAPPFGLLDLADISAFVSGFVSGEPIADLDDNGLFDLGDISAFVGAFLAGCP